MGRRSQSFTSAWILSDSVEGSLAGARGRGDRASQISFKTPVPLKKRLASAARLHMALILLGSIMCSMLGSDGSNIDLSRELMGCQSNERLVFLNRSLFLDFKASVRHEAILDCE